MKRVLVAAVLATLVGTLPATMALASDYQRDGYNDGDRYDRYDRNDRNDRRYRDQYRHRHYWRVGQHIDDRYYRRGNWVNWRHQHLYRPRYGAQWIYVDGVYLQITTRDGVILSIVDVR